MSDLDFMGRIAEGKIQEAIEEGKFDDLPGKGKPIVFDDDPLTPPHLRLLNRILSNANVLPDWMQVQKDIVADQRHIVELKTRLARENQRWGKRLSQAPSRHGTARQYAEWHTNSRLNYLRMLKGVNGSILKFTLTAPSSARPVLNYSIRDEMAAFDQDVPNFVASNDAPN